MKKMKQVLVLGIPFVMMSACGTEKAAKLGVSDATMNALKSVKGQKISSLKGDAKTAMDELLKALYLGDYEVQQCHAKALKANKEACAEMKKKCENVEVEIDAEKTLKSLKDLRVSEVLNFQKNIKAQRATFEAAECGTALEDLEDPEMSKLTNIIGTKARAGSKIKGGKVEANSVKGPQEQNNQMPQRDLPNNEEEDLELDDESEYDGKHDVAPSRRGGQPYPIQKEGFGMMQYDGPYGKGEQGYGSHNAGFTFGNMGQHPGYIVK